MRIRLAQFRPEPLDFGVTLLRLDFGECSLRDRVSFTRSVAVVRRRELDEPDFR
jgi:hypothetical protein